MGRKEELDQILEGVDPSQKKLVSKLVDEVLYLEEMLAYLKTLPAIRVHPKDLTKQEITSAGKLYKDMQGSYANDIRILLSLLSKADHSAENELLKKLAEFE